MDDILPRVRDGYADELVKDKGFPSSLHAFPQECTLGKRRATRLVLLKGPIASHALGQTQMAGIRYGCHKMTKILMLKVHERIRSNAIGHNSRRHNQPSCLTHALDLSLGRQQVPGAKQWWVLLKGVIQLTNQPVSIMFSIGFMWWVTGSLAAGSTTCSGTTT